MYHTKSQTLCFGSSHATLDLTTVRANHFCRKQDSQQQRPLDHIHSLANLRPLSYFDKPSLTTFLFPLIETKFWWTHPWLLPKRLLVSESSYFVVDTLSCYRTGISVCFYNELEEARLEVDKRCSIQQVARLFMGLKQRRWLAWWIC